MSAFTGYRCSQCGETYGPDEVTYTCPEDGSNLNVTLDMEAIRSRESPSSISASFEASIWRYLPLLPVDFPGHVGSPLWGVGWSPMYRPARLASLLEMEDLWLKDDGRNPTASFKDRASAVAIVRAQEIEAEVVITASTGNAGAALAGMAAAVGAEAVILAPESAPPAKIAQLLIFGARVVLIDGTYDDAFALSVEAAEAFGWYCRNTGYNPFTAEGKKTAAFEICEQLTFASLESPPQGVARTWMAPEAVFVSVGDGNIIVGLHKGFRELHELGWIDRVPKMFGIQSSGSAAITNAFEANTEAIQPVESDTLADSISVDMPNDGIQALRAASQTGGAYLAVEDRAILEAIVTLAREAGVFAEPAGATAYAGLVEARKAGLVSSEDRVLVLNTGNGLKDIGAAMEAAGKAQVIEPNLERLKSVLEAG